MSKKGLDRLPPMSADPVGDALAGAGVVISRHDGSVLDPEELRELIEVHDLDPLDVLGMNTELSWPDEISFFADTEADGLALALADQPGIEALEEGDREWLHVLTRLSIEDTHAAAIRAVLEINRHPREVPSIYQLTSELICGLAAGLTPALAAHGFHATLRMFDESGRLLGPHGFWRMTAEGLLQAVTFGEGIGSLGEGKDLAGSITVSLHIFDPPEDSVDRVELIMGRDWPQGVLVAREAVYLAPPNLAGLERLVDERCLPVLDRFSGRRAIVRAWCSPKFVLNHVYPPLNRAAMAERWGFPAEAVQLRR